MVVPEGVEDIVAVDPAVAFLVVVVVAAAVVVALLEASSHPSVVELVAAHLELQLPLVVVAEMLKVDQFVDPREVPTKLFKQKFKIKINNL